MNMTRYIQLFLLLAITLLSGCGEVTVFGHVVREGHSKTEVKGEPASNTTSQAATSSSNSSSNSSKSSETAPPIRLIKAVTLLMTPEVTAALAKDHRLNTNELLTVIRAELHSRKLLDADASSSVTLMVYIDQYELHANTNFVIFGSTPHTGTLAGNLTLRDSQDNDVPLSHVEAYSRISVPESGETPDLLQPLYKQFALTVANALVAPTHP